MVAAGTAGRRRIDRRAVRSGVPARLETILACTRRHATLEIGSRTGATRVHRGRPTATQEVMVRRMLLKMSGEAIVDVDAESVISVDRLDAFSAQIAEAREVAHANGEELEIAVVVGGGNILRGKALSGVSRTKADHMGMLATVINALALQDALSRVEL